MDVQYCFKCYDLVEKEHNTQHQIDCKDVMIDKINKALDKMDIYTVKQFFNYIMTL